MMSILNRLIRLGLESPLVCGLWIDGHHCEALKMDLRANGVYRLIELDNFELPKSIDDLTKVRTIVQKLLKIKRLIDIMTEDIERSIKMRKASQSSNHPCKMAHHQHRHQITWHHHPAKFRIGFEHLLTKTE
ncbi:hypothetical protein BC941DRAFT_193891 [Chlamydoabsidia padenii]|nr:hypothetical protein BC941DRAFT_193891 [Chlamydoabsidia padenii]